MVNSSIIKKTFKRNLEYRSLKDQFISIFKNAYFLSFLQISMYIPSYHISRLRELEVNFGFKTLMLRNVDLKKLFKNNLIHSFKGSLVLLLYRYNSYTMPFLNLTLLNNFFFSLLGIKNCNPFLFILNSKIFFDSSSLLSFFYVISNLTSLFPYQILLNWFLKISLTSIDFFFNSSYFFLSYLNDSFYNIPLLERSLKKTKFCI